MSDWPYSPDAPAEIAAQKGNRDTLAAWFKAHPWQDINPDDLEKMVGRNYQQRISDCRTDLGMTIENVPRTATDAAGKVKRLSGAYRYRPTGEAQGRDSGTFTPASWPTEHGTPYQEEFRLKP